MLPEEIATVSAHAMIGTIEDIKSMEITVPYCFLGLGYKFNITIEPPVNDLVGTTGKQI
jgi:hypothetical protein